MCASPSAQEQFALAHEVYYTRQEFAKLVADTPWWKNKPIMCQVCEASRDLVCEARLQVHGVWLCLEHQLAWEGKRV